jgi:transposase InsO family protein
VAGGSGRPRTTRYEGAYRVKVVKTALEKDLTAAEVAQVYGISDATFYAWRKVYQERGEVALLTESGRAKRNDDGRTGPAKEKYRRQILAAKEQHPDFGAGRVMTWLRRTLFLPITYRQAHATLKEENLLQKAVRRRKSPTPRLQSFERARPNQLWQSDITAFTIVGGLRVYLIGFLDDHSRYLVGWGLYAGQSGKLVIEVLKRAISVYKRPQEILTDNGRQYKSWHGPTEFQKEIKREGIRHITSRPHHPQTLGKIESFWGHLKKEWLARVVMGDLESMRERLGHWVNYYNFQRPHEGIGKATPAERYFRYAEAMRSEIERRIAANERDLSLADPAPGRVIGQAPVGDIPVEVRKDGVEYVVTMGGREVSRTDLNPNPEESDHEAQEAAAGTDRGDGRGGEGEGGGGAGGALGGEVDRAGVRGDGAETLVVLQAGGENAARDAGGGADAVGEAAGPLAGGGGGDAGGGDGGATDGAPADEEPDAGEPEADGAGGGETAPHGPPEAENGGFAGGAGAAGTSAEDAGDAPGAGGDNAGGAAGGISDATGKCGEHAGGPQAPGGGDAGAAGAEGGDGGVPGSGDFAGDLLRDGGQGAGGGGAGPASEEARAEGGDAGPEDRGAERAAPAGAAGEGAAGPEGEGPHGDQ